jgi:hypothetical protein
MISRPSIPSMPTIYEFTGNTGTQIINYNTTNITNCQGISFVPKVTRGDGSTTLNPTYMSLFATPGEVQVETTTQYTARTFTSTSFDLVYQDPVSLVSATISILVKVVDT